MQKKWYLSTWVIVIMFAAWIFIIPPIIGIVLAILRLKQEKKNELMFEEAQADLQKMKDFNESIGFHRYEDVTSKVEEINLEIQELLTEKETKKEEIILEAKAEKDLIIQEMNEQKDNLESVIISLNQKISELNNIIAQNQSKVSDLNISISELNEKEAKKTKQLTNQENKLRRLKELYKSVEYCIQNFFAFTPQSEHLLLSSNDFDEVEKLAPTIMSQLHCMNIKDLRKAYRDNDKNIDTILNRKV